MKTVFLLLALSLTTGVFASKGSINAKALTVDKELPTETYRSDQFTPGVISEYMKVTLSKDRQSIVKIEYWYIYRDNMETNESEKYTLKLKNAEGFEGEEVGKKGMLQLPDNEEWYSFVIAEGMFDLVHEEDRIQTYEIE